MKKVPLPLFFLTCGSQKEVLELEAGNKLIRSTIHDPYHFFSHLWLQGATVYKSSHKSTVRASDVCGRVG